MKPYKIVSAIVGVAMLFAIFLLIYMAFFERPIKSRRLINEIVTSKMDSATYSDSKRSTFYEYYVGSKYHITVTQRKKIPFEQKERSELYIQNINGEYIFDARFDHPWDKDIDKLFDYFQTCKEYKQR